MATYRVDFSTNASRVAQEIDRVNKALTEAVRTSKPIEIKLDDVGLSQQLNTTFKKLDKEIAKYQRQLRKIQIGVPEFGLKASQIGQLQGERERAQMTARAIGLRAASSAFPQESFAGLSRELEAARVFASMIQPNTEAWTNLQREIARLNLDLKKADKLAENVQLTEQLGAFSPGSLDALEAKLTILRNRAREISPSTPEWKKLNQELVKTEQAIEKQTRRPLTRGQRLGAAGGAFLYGGGFSGAGSAVGGITGGLMGGVPGAFTGAAIGQAVDSMTAFTAAMTEQAVAVRRLQIGLASASTDIIDFAMAVRATEDISNRLLIPIDEATRKFTQLRASTVALGFDVETTAKIFEGTTAAVLMAGGSLDDVDGAMRAVVQVFSKGKLTAEELRGQLAERLPGAVVEFAQSAGMSVQELDKAFDSGTTSIDDFVVFLRKKAQDTSGFVDEMATSSEFAGARMNKAFERLRINIGNALQPTGAAIQDFATGAINFLDGVIRKAIELQLIQPGANFYAQEALSGAAGGMAGLEKKIKELRAQESALQERAGWAAFMDANLKGVQRELKAREDGLKKIRDLEKQTKKREVEITNEQEQQKKDARAQKFLDTIERREEALANARENYEQEIASIRENAIKQAEALERRYKDQRLQDEREIGRVRRELAAAIEEENLLRRGIAGEDPALLEQERKIGEAIRQYTEDKISREEEAQDRQIGLSRELEDFKRQNADAINKANERYANAIGKIQQEYAKSVAKLIEEGSGNGAKKLAAAGKLIAAQIARASAQEAFVTATGAAIIPRGAGAYEVAGQQMTEAQLLAAAEKSSPNTKTAAKAFVDATRQIEQAQKDLSASVKLTAQTGSVSLSPVSTADLESGVQARIGALTASLAAINKERTALSQQGIENTILGIVENIRKEAFNNVREIDRQNEALTEQVELIKGGTLPSLAEEASLRGRLFDQQRNLINAAIDQLSNSEEGKNLLQESATLHSSILADLTKELDVVSAQEKSYANIQQTLRDNAALLEAAQIQSQIGIVGQGLRAGFINEAGVAFEQQISQGVSPEVAAQVARATEQLMLAKQAADALQSSIQGIGSAFGEALTTGVASLISGTATAKEVFADFLQSVGQALSQAASQMIATYIAIGIAKMFAGFGGGGGGGKGLDTSGFKQYPILEGAGFANGGIALGGFQAFADGGIVSGPTLGLVGEGKYNEAIVPLPNGRSIPVQLTGQRSARDVMSRNAQATAQASPINLSFETTKIGNVEYVSRDQLEAAMAETRRAAISGGAARGMNMTLDRIQQSPSVRSRIGIR